MPAWPEWWSYEIVISPHVMERMQERGFSEVDLRGMLEDASGFHDSAMSGRFCIETHWHAELWEVVVEPDDVERSLIVVTAYRVE